MMNFHITFHKLNTDFFLNFKMSNFKKLVCPLVLFAPAEMRYYLVSCRSHHSAKSVALGNVFSEAPIHFSPLISGIISQPFRIVSEY
jgi:hypothetical protein